MTNEPAGKTNINTWITLAGFALTILVNSMSYQAFKTETEVWRQQLAADLQEAKEQRSNDLLAINNRIDAVDRDGNSQEVLVATLSAQMTSLRESVTELKAGQAEGNNLLREALSEFVKP